MLKALGGFTGPNIPIEDLFDFGALWQIFSMSQWNYYYYYY